MICFRSIEGLMFSSTSMGQKAGSGFTSAIMGAILSWAAFDGLKETAAEQTVTAIKTFYLYVPIAIWVIMFLIAACYKLDKTYDRMMSELVASEKAESLAIRRVPIYKQLKARTDGCVLLIVVLIYVI